MNDSSRVALIWLVAASAAQAVACSAQPEGQAGAPAPLEVRCEALTRRTLQTVVHLRGRVAAPPETDAIVSSAVAGRIASMHVVEGDSVAAGQLLAVVENPSLASDRDQAAAAVASARAAVRNAEQALEREQGLFELGIAARRAVEDAKATVATATAEFSSARARSELASRQLERAQVQAPFAGTVVKVMRRTGELVDGTPGTPIVQVADVSALQLACDVASTDLVHIERGATAEVHLDALVEPAIDGRIARVAPTVDPTTSLGQVRIALSPPPALAGRLHIGMAGGATVDAGQREALVVPPSALRRSQDGKDELVLCVPRDGGTVASPAEVSVGVRTRDWVEITEGASAGTRAVVDRALGLEDGAPIAPRGQSDAGEPAR